MSIAPPARPLWRAAGLALAVVLAVAALVTPDAVGPRERVAYEAAATRPARSVVGLVWEQIGDDSRLHSSGWFKFPKWEAFFLFWMVFAVMLFGAGVLCLAARRRGETLLCSAPAIVIGGAVLLLFGGVGLAPLLWAAACGVLAMAGAQTGPVAPTKQPYAPKPAQPRYASTRNPFAEGVSDSPDAPEEIGAREGEMATAEPIAFLNEPADRPLVAPARPDDGPNRPRVRGVGFVVALGLYATSFFLPVAPDSDAVGGQLFVTGILAIFFFPPLLFVWCANPVFYVGLWHLARGNGSRAVWLGGSALALGSGGLSVLPPGPACAVWLGSFAVLAASGYFGGALSHFHPRIRPAVPNPFADSLDVKPAAKTD